MQAQATLMPVTMGNTNNGSPSTANNITEMKAKVAHDHPADPATAGVPARVVVARVNKLGAEPEPIGFIKIAPTATLAEAREQIMTKVLRGSALEKKVAADLPPATPAEENKGEGKDDQTAAAATAAKSFRFMVTIGDLYTPIALEQEVEETVGDLLPVLRISTPDDDQPNADDSEEEEEGDEEEGAEGEGGKKKKKAKGAVGEQATVDVKKGGFKVERKEVQSPCTGEMVKVVSMVFDKKANEELVRVLRCVTGDEEFYREEPKVNVRSMIRNIQKIRDQHGDEKRKAVLAEVLAFLEEEYADQLKAMEEMLKNGEVTFDALWYMFKVGTKVFSSELGHKYGFELVESGYHRSWMGTYFTLTGKVIKTNGSMYYQDDANATISQYNGIKSITELTAQPMTDSVLKSLSERGAVFREHGLGGHYREYSGSMFYRQWNGVQNFRADGRVMIDGATFGKFNPNYRNYRNSEDDDEEEGDMAGNMKLVSDDVLYTTWPMMYGFSFFAKKWGEFAIDRLAPCKFDTEAFDRLVLHEEKKSLVRSLVKNRDLTFTDIISGKGGGCIFLLHGNPGTGKTLTAEAIAELLHRPLYSVSAGEIGVTPTELEETLRGILELSHTWNAVILIDEADIFLEKRTMNDIHRNALVGIFLRLLEYHEGVLFLTTNRVSCFDEAFHSRIAVALKYAPLDTSARHSVWTNLLNAAKIDGLDIGKLAEFELNGRQIKNTVRLAQSLAQEEGVKVCHRHIERTVKVSRQFQEDINSGYDNK